MNNARLSAFKALLHVDVNEGYSNIVLDKTLAEFSMDSRDKALASAIFYGVLERRITLNYIIKQFSNTPVKKMSPKVLEILRMGVYQILYLEKIPNSAAVNESVTLAKENGAVKAAGFINAVLRNLVRSIDKIKMPEYNKDPLLYLSVKYSCPKWLIEHWTKSYGMECTINLLKSTYNKPPIFARVNNTLVSVEELIDRLNSEDVKAEAITTVNGAVEIENTGSISELKSFQEGLFHIQDLSSQICCNLFNPKSGERIIDVCSAPGGKAFTIAEIMNNKGELLAFDKYKGKAGLINKGAKRLNLSIIRASVRDATKKDSKPLELADRVLCDVPCSGLGIVRRKPEIKYKSKSAIDSLPDLQYLILCRASKLVKNGGILFYSTCTLNPKENNEVAAKFIENNNDFAQVSLNLPDFISHVVDEPKNQLTLMPHIHNTDGFFIAAFQKK